MISIAIIMTVFNRIEKTKKCIDSILAENSNDQFHFSFYITNDGCTDKTAEELDKYKATNPKTEFYVLQGTGNLFWNRGMHLAYGEALKKEYDYYMWVNNDVTFLPGFLMGLIRDAEEATKNSKLVIVCGSTLFVGSNEWSYGGTIKLSKVNPYKRKKVIPNGHIQKCDCINGNCLLIPYETGVCIGNLDDRYEHGLGDFDYGYMLLKQGGQNYVASKYAGVCDRNSEKGTWKDPAVPFKTRIKKKNSPLGQPIESHRIFLKKWFPHFWLYYLYKPYVGIAVTSIMHKLSKKVE